MNILEVSYITTTDISGHNELICDYIYLMIHITKVYAYYIKPSMCIIFLQIILINSKKQYLKLLLKL